MVTLVAGAAGICPEPSTKQTNASQRSQRCSSVSKISREMKETGTGVMNGGDTMNESRADGV